MKRKEDKKKLRDQQIIAGMTSIDMAVRHMQSHAQQYNNWIDKAALSGNDARARSLLARKIRVNKFIKRLEDVKVAVEEGVFTTTAIAKLSDLPGAISACVNIRQEVPDFKKMGDNIKNLFAGLNEAENEIKKLTEILSVEPINNVDIDPDLAGIPQYNPNPIESTPEFKAEYEAMLDRIKPYVGSSKVPQNNDTGNIDIDGLVNDINNETK